MNQTLESGWHVLQDVYDTAEALGLQNGDLDATEIGPQTSEWEPIDRLQHLQLLFARTPYWGRELRYFNAAPWWYRNDFMLANDAPQFTLRFSNVDYFCRVWLNGELLGEHEGYATPIEFDITEHVRRNGENNLVVKVWSPWDHEVQDDHYAKRAFKVERRMVKGTYEHDDALIARDVNPVGIYGTVTVTGSGPVRLEPSPEVDYDLDIEGRAAVVNVSANLVGSGSVNCEVTVNDELTGAQVARSVQQVSLGDQSAAVRVQLPVDEVALWSTWDRGGPRLYRVQIRAGDAHWSQRIGFRSAAMRRSPEETTLLLNGDALYVRGTSYFPDNYISAMTRERYLRDLTAIRAAGFNLVRVHVHVLTQEFYALCDELGLAVMQDSDYNWTHPDDDAWVEKFARMHAAIVRLLSPHPSIVTWVALNEPGFIGSLHAGEGTGPTVDHSGGTALTISPGPQVFAAIQEADPTRPIIKGSFVKDDPDSGDSHNYKGSLEGNHEDYVAIDGSTEKLNSEFGFDAPGIVENLRTQPAIVRRLHGILTDLGSIQHYQSRLIKYYIEHYRMQRWQPNSGYIQFMFIDLSPQSFYGLYDWWGYPKPAVEHIAPSNQPTAVIIRQTATQASGIVLINDTRTDFGNVTVTVTAWDEGQVILQESYQVRLGPDQAIDAGDFILRKEETTRVDAVVAAVAESGSVVARNSYRSLFNHPRHVEGHQHRLSHELGLRLYHA